MDSHRLLHAAVGFGLGLTLLSFHVGPDHHNPFGVVGVLGLVGTAGFAKEMYDEVRCQKTPSGCESTAHHLGDIGATLAGGTLAVGVHVSFR